jgi:hypothetical protein
MDSSSLNREELLDLHEVRLREIRFIKQGLRVLKFEVGPVVVDPDDLVDPSIEIRKGDWEGHIQIFQERGYGVGWWINEETMYCMDFETPSELMRFFGRGDYKV